MYFLIFVTGVSMGVLAATLFYTKKQATAYLSISEIVMEKNTEQLEILEQQNKISEKLLEINLLVVEKVDAIKADIEFTRHEGLELQRDQDMSAVEVPMEEAIEILSDPTFGESKIEATDKV